MGFFSDLKEDLNQAVNELLPGGETEDLKAGKVPAADKNDDENDVMKELEELEATLQSIDAMQEEQAIRAREEQAAKAQEAMAAAEKEKEEAAASAKEEPSVIEEVKEPAPAEPKLQDYVQETFAEVEGQLKISVVDDVKEEKKAEEIKPEPVKEKEAVKSDEAMETPLRETAKETAAKEAVRAKYDALEGEKKVDGYVGRETVKPEDGVIDKSWILDLRNMEEMDETAVITAGMRVKGDILSNGSADVFGEVYGNVQVKGKLNVTGKITGNSKADEIFADAAKINGDMISDGAVKIGVGTVVVGNVEATDAVIAGAVKGTIDVKGPVVIDATAVVLGNIRAKSMQINNGARIEGMCVLCYAEQSAAKFFEEQEQ